MPPVLTERSFYLSAPGLLQSGPPTGGTPVSLVLTDEQSASFDLPLPGGAALGGRPEVTLWTQLRGTEPDHPGKDVRRVHGHLRLTLADCGPGGCTRLAKGELNLEQDAGAEPAPAVRDLSRLRDVVPAGDVLRLTLEVEAKPGVAVVVLHDAAATPSRVVLPSGAATTGRDPLAGAVLLLAAVGLVQVGRRVRR